jgi:hypothetical protein
LNVVAIENCLGVAFVVETLRYPPKIRTLFQPER